MSHRYIVDLVNGVWIFDFGCEQVALHTVVNVAKISARKPVTVYKCRSFTDQIGKPLRNHRGIIAIGILSGTEHIKISQADTFDAVTTDRPYRKKRKIAEAIQEIKKCSGTQFDPEVANAFLKAYKKGKIV